MDINGPNNTVFHCDSCDPPKAYDLKNWVGELVPVPIPIPISVFAACLCILCVLFLSDNILRDGLYMC